MCEGVIIGDGSDAWDFYATGEHNSQQKRTLVQENAKNEQQTHTADNWKDRAKIC